MPETKTCTKCGETKPLDQFHRHHARKDGREWLCRSCKSKYDYLRRGSSSSNGYWKNRENTWRQQGILNADGSPFLRTDYKRLSDIQGGICALCGRRPPMWSETLAVDHDRKTGRVRGLLCVECNHRAVGTFERHGRFGRRQDVNDLIRSYLVSPPASRLPRTEETEGLENAPVVQTTVTNPQEYHISWTPLFSHEVTP